MKYKVISMYTVNTPYEEEVNYLKESCERFGLEYKMVAVKSTGDWVKNTQLKPRVIASALKKFPGVNIVWLDADAVVVQKPELFDTLDCDFSAVLRPHKEHVRHRLLSGTMFFKNNKKVRKLCSDWVSACEDSDLWDQEVLWNTLQKHLGKLSVVSLPEAYTKIKAMGDDNAEPTGVIWHNQRSREVRQGIWKV